jgi:D-aminoacyl-tRNA deacylase
MRLVVQRVSSARVSVAGEVTGEIERGFVVLLGITHADGKVEAEYMAQKVAGLRLFEDAEGKMNLALSEVGGAVLVVSQFTLYGNVRKGRRPSFTDAARPEQALQLYEEFCGRLRTNGLVVATGKFQAHMEVAMVNDGPVTLWLDSVDMAVKQ